MVQPRTEQLIVLQLGLMKEVLPCRHFQAGPALPEQAALDISCAFNYSELTVVQLVPLDALPTLGSGKDNWDPVAQGLPADITEQLSQTVSPPSDQKSLSKTRAPTYECSRGRPEQPWQDVQGPGHCVFGSGYLACACAKHSLWGCTRRGPNTDSGAYGFGVLSRAQNRSPRLQARGPGLMCSRTHRCFRARPPSLWSKLCRTPLPRALPRSPLRKLLQSPRSLSPMRTML